MQTLRNSRKLRISVVYVVISIAWIVISDSLLFVAIDNSETLTVFQILKGWLFIFLSGVLIYYLLHQDERKQKGVNADRLEKQKTLEALYGNLPGMAYRCRNDEKWTMEFISEGCYPLTGYHASDLVSNEVVSYASLIHPEDREYVWEEVQNSINEQRRFQLTYRLITKSGEEKWVWEQGLSIEETGEGNRFLDGFIMDITELRKLESDLQVQFLRLNSLKEIDSAIISGEDPDRIYKKILDQTAKRLEVDSALLLLMDDDTKTMHEVIRVGKSANEKFIQHTIKVGEGHPGKVALTKEKIVIPDLQIHLEEFRRASISPFKESEYYVAVPLLVYDQVIGVLELFNLSEKSPTQDWFIYLDILAGQLAIAVHLLKTIEELQEANKEITNAYSTTIEGWANALELKDKETKGHSERVTSLTMRLAKNLGIIGEDLRNIYMGALLHDIGKMGIPDKILFKDGPLTETEWEMMRKHPTYAYNLLANINYLKPALDIPRYHHERWDGSGYPEGLKGEEIPLAARIFMIVDVWDALISPRPYRESWPREKALNYIISNSGILFDPLLTTEFVEIVGNQVGEMASS